MSPIGDDIGRFGRNFHRLNPIASSHSLCWFLGSWTIPSSLNCPRILVALFPDFLVVLQVDHAIGGPISTSRIYPHPSLPGSALLFIPCARSAFSHAVNQRSSSSIACSSLARPIYAQLLSAVYPPDTFLAASASFSRSFTLFSSRPFSASFSQSPTFVLYAKVAPLTNNLRLILPTLRFKAICAWLHISLKAPRKSYPPRKSPKPLNCCAMQ
jgi:hypothetical protein